MYTKGQVEFKGFLLIKPISLYSILFDLYRAIMQVSYHKKDQQHKYLIAMASHMATPFSYSHGFTFVCEISENAPIKFTCPTVLHCVYIV